MAPGLYWLAAAAQGGAPQMRVFTIAPSFYTPHDLAGIKTNNRSGFYGTASGAFASAPTIAGVIATPPRVFVRAA